MKEKIKLTDRIQMKKERDHANGLDNPKMTFINPTTNSLNRMSEVNDNQETTPTSPLNRESTTSHQAQDRSFVPFLNDAKVIEKESKPDETAPLVRPPIKEKQGSSRIETTQENPNRQTRQRSTAQPSNNNNNNNSTATSRAVKLIVEPFELINFTKWECDKTINEHGTLKITGLVSEENRVKYIEMGMQETWVSAKAIDEQGKEITLFQGIVTDLVVDSRHEYHTMSIEVKTGTYLLAQTNHTRTFQEDTTTYQEVIETCLNQAGGRFIMREKETETTKQFTVQYKESDWSFIKRLAHRLGIVVLPEFKTEGKKLYLGLNRSIQGTEITTDDYSVSKGLNDKNSLINYEHGIYYIKTRAIYELGQPVIFQERKLFITTIKSYLEGSELIHEYTLSHLKPAYEMPTRNEKIRGVSMKSKVTSVNRAKVQISIHEDENSKSSGFRWFDYATVYSSPDGTGFYAMPEIKDEVRVLFPNADESGAYVVSNVHLETSGGRTNPNHKSFKNKQNKEILFTEDKLLLTNNAGLLVELNDASGITMNSNRNIIIEADGTLLINSENAGITISGKQDVTVSQGASQINMNDAIDIVGGKINMN